MAITTDTRKLSVLNISLPWRPIGAIPSGALDEEEFYSLAYLYNEFAAALADGDVAAAAGFADTFTAVATAYASLAAAIGAGDSDSSAASTIGSISSAVSAGAATSAIAAAIDIVNAALAAGESWAAAVEAAADFASFAILGDSFVAELASAQAGLVVSTSSLAGDFIDAADAISSLTDGASLQSVIQTVALSMASLSVGAILGSQFDVVEPVVEILAPAKATLIVTPRPRSLRS